MRGAIAATIIVTQFLGLLCAAAAVGKPREPLTSEVFTGTLVVTLGIIVGTYWLWASA